MVFAYMPTESRLEYKVTFPGIMDYQQEQQQSSADLSETIIDSLTCAGKDFARFTQRITENEEELVPRINRDGLFNTRPHPLGSTAPTLGKFDKFPAEMLITAIKVLPYEDIRAFMQVNKYAWNTVVAIPEYRELTQHGRGILTTLWQNGLRSCFSFIDVHQVLTNPNCAYCPMPIFGGYVFLPGLVRCCRHCASKDPRCLAVQVSRAMKKDKHADGREYGLTKRTIESLPVMRPRPWYTEKKVLLISRPLAQQAMKRQLLRQDPTRSAKTIPHVRIEEEEKEGRYIDPVSS